jgi:hypothetical protein
MPHVKLTKSAIDSLRPHNLDVGYWDTRCPGFGLKIKPKGRKVFIVLYRTGGAGSVAEYPAELPLPLWPAR